MVFLQKMIFPIFSSKPFAHDHELKLQFNDVKQMFQVNYEKHKNYCPLNKMILQFFIVKMRYTDTNNLDKMLYRISVNVIETLHKIFYQFYNQGNHFIFCFILQALSMLYITTLYIHVLICIYLKFILLSHMTFSISCHRNTVLGIYLGHFVCLEFYALFYSPC